MDEMHKIGILVVPITWLVALIVAIIIYFGCNNQDNSIWALSYIIGVATSLLNFGLTLKGGRRFQYEVKKQDEGKPVKKVIFGYVMRLVVAMVVFAAVIYDQFNSKEPRFNIIPTLIGYLTLKIVLITVVLIKRGKVTE